MSCCTPSAEGRTSCCTPSAGDDHVIGTIALGPPGPFRPAAADRTTRGQVSLPGGAFAMSDAFGEGYVADGEGPAHDVRLDPFLVDATTVTNAAFAAFVKDTGYMTDAERLGMSAVFHTSWAAAHIRVR
ncbi:SUMF1/EgtB/PvdO family nonheme iron enzyme [Streptomyces viridosporus]|uniref:Sulfatase-modifying factor enzyme-like domain-containing protein n=1 Tax=Streptomyces viridosporus (strain ATCC 14672 / DSM 40746 / JCM 4963 / KCTC 9882 / NRRL B-12104 / FH 1290) TaxID=566461 RepID=D5ZNX0_STRV1|nr:conserved hypothetical protein [Streptomyces viridosporus ATCC 14672]